MKLTVAAASFALCILVGTQSVRADKPAGDADLDKLAFGMTVVSLSDVQPLLKKNNIKLSRRIGAFVTKVVRYSPAYGAKLRRYDIIVRIGKKAVKDAGDFREAIDGLKGNETYDVKMYRRVRIRSGRYVWKSGSVKIKPVTRRTMYLAAMRIEKDDVTGTTFYRHKDSPAAVNSQSNLYAYFSIKGKETRPLRMVFQYVAKDWLFIRSYTVKADSKTFTVSAKGIESDNTGRIIWEWNDLQVSAAHMSMLNAIVDADATTIRCHGDKYQKDRELSDAERERLETVLKVYKILGGK